MKVVDRIAEWHEQNRKDGRVSETVVRAGPIQIAKSAEADGKNGRIVLLRNDSLFIAPLIASWERGYREKLYTLLTTEYRAGAAHPTTQFPAESLETGEELHEAALRAFDEETPIHRSWVRGVELLDLGKENYVSPGGSNEQLWYARADVRLPRGIRLKDLHNRITGLAEHGERITTSVHEFRRELFFTLSNAADKLALLLILEKERDS